MAADVADAEAARSLGDTPSDVTAEAVLGNIEAMTWAVDSLAAAPEVNVEGLLDVHRLLLQRTRLAEHAGNVRTQQNWIGGSSYNPCSAAFVPPPPDHVHELLADLCEFANTDDLPALAQAALLIDAFAALEPQLASPSADTQSAPRNGPRQHLRSTPEIGRGPRMG